ncbi:hypothetical protein FB451DRAFT_1415448 [Mycena latifolia]|nr:hypothetical protein FB451DRAFT_1415448 [Mycena latifolia]
MDPPSEISFAYLFVSVWVISFLFIVFVVNGPCNFPQACKSILGALTFAAVELMPLHMLAAIAIVVFSYTFLGSLAWFSVFVGHDCSDIPHFQTQFTKHLYKLMVLDTHYFGEHAILLFIGLDCTMSLFYLLIYERRQFAKEIKCDRAKRLAIEQTTAHAQHTAQRCVKQLAEASASLVCLICVDRLTQPYTLAPCGHTFDLDCLQTWFRSAHPSPADEQLALTLDPHGALYALRRKKFCPLCHAEVAGCPAPAVALLALGMEPAEERNPWKDLFGFVPSRIPRPVPK